MITERSPYSLDSVQLEKAVQALQKAAETLGPNPSETRLYRVLKTCVRVAVAACAGMLVLAFLVNWVYRRPGGTETALSGFLGILTFLFALLFFLAAIGALVFLVLNQSVVRQAFRQRRLMKELGIRDVSLSAWRLQRRGHFWSRLAGAVLTLIAVCCLVFGVVYLLLSIFVKVWILAVSAGLLAAFGVTVLVWRFVQRSREQWAIVADANRLRSAFESMRTKAGAGEAVAIPAAMVEHAAQIERVQIARERSDAVMASAGTTGRGYGVLVARDLSLQKGLLDPQQRIAVEDLIDNLSANPRPPGVESTVEGLLSVRTPKGDQELKYNVDEEAHRVHIVALTTHDHG